MIGLSHFHALFHPRCYTRRLADAIMLALVLALASISAHAQDRYPQRADRFINDHAHLLNAADAATLRTICADLVRNRGVELVIVTIDSVGDYDTPHRTIESFATNLFNTWGIGDRRRNDGVLLLAAVKDRKVRIEVGSGYGNRHNAAMQQVIDRDILPSFRENNYSQGIVQGARAIAAALVAPQPATGSAPQSITVLGRSVSIPAMPLAPAMLGGVAGLGLATFGVMGYLKTRPRRCPRCRAPMTRLDKVSTARYLDPGRRLEHELGSVVYTVWQCTQCGTPSLERSAHKLSQFSDCPHCGYHTIQSSSAIVNRPTSYSTGRKEITSNCGHCGYHFVAFEILPVDRDDNWSDSSDSSSGWGSDSSDSSSDSGGGDSSGDGASGDW